MNEGNAKRLITAKQAEAYVPPLDQFIGCYALRDKLQNWLKRPVENDSNLLVEGPPGTGKTAIIIAYLREQFKNPWFHAEEIDPATLDAKAACLHVDLEWQREWQTKTGHIYFVKQLDGATDSEAELRRKIKEVLTAESAHHKVAVLDELGEAFFRGLDEMFRPLLTETGISNYATAQNFHSKRKSDSSKQEDERLSALLRRFTHREKTELPTEAEHLKLLVFLMKEWSLKIDQPETLRVAVEKSNNIAGYSRLFLIKAIDEPDRRLTRKLVEDSDVVPER